MMDPKEKQLSIVWCGNSLTPFTVDNIGQKSL